MEGGDLHEAGKKGHEAMTNLKVCSFNGEPNSGNYGKLQGSHRNRQWWSRRERAATVAAVAPVYAFTFFQDLQPFLSLSLCLPVNPLVKDASG
ncbi:hypothetical protein PIB30_115499, partial [Stylosanthes scabra]|nr:hypothetical protein [Stylosanthes scabra]